MADGKLYVSLRSYFFFESLLSFYSPLSPFLWNSVVEHWHLDVLSSDWVSFSSSSSSLLFYSPSSSCISTFVIGGKRSFGWGRERERKRQREKKKKRKSEGWSISLHGAVGNAYRVARDKWPPVNGIETLLYPREKTSRLLWNFYNFICRSTSGLTTVPPLLRRHSVIQWFCVSLLFLWRGVIGVDLCDQMLDLIALYIGRWGIYSFLQSPRWDWKFHDYFQ